MKEGFFYRLYGITFSTCISHDPGGNILKRVTPIRFLLIALAALAFGAVSVASAQWTSQSQGWNAANATISSQGETIDRVEFTIPNRFVVHPYGNFRPDANIQVAVPVTNTTQRPITCNIVAHHGAVVGDTAAGREIGMRLATFTAGSDITVAAGSTGTIYYWLQFGPASVWNATDFGQTAYYNVKVTCTGILPAVQNMSH